MRDASPDRVPDGLIDELASQLTPVRPLASPLVRALIWGAMVFVVGMIAAPLANLNALEQRLTASPDLWLAASGSALTAATAVFASFQLSLPDRSRRWALLPAPFVLLWVGASGVGCLRQFSIGGIREPTVNDERDCLLIILGLSIPLSMSLLAMLRRGYSLHPHLTALLAGLAVAAAAATLLLFFHPFDALVSDLMVHAIAVGIVIGAIRWVGGHRLDSRYLQRAT